jgi:TolB-like protein
MAGEIFISYRRADQAWARLLHAQLRAEGIEAWYDAQVGAGQDWRLSTAKALQDCQIFVLLFSANAAQSSDIAKELAAAVFEKKLIIPVRLEDIAPSGAFLYELASRNWVNAFENREAKLAELAKGLAQLVRTGARDESVLPFDRSGDHAGASAPKRPSAARNWYAVAALAVLVVVAGGAAIFLHRPPPPAPSAPAPARIAVLPFEILGGDDALRGFAGGLQAEIVGQLSQNQLPVISQTPGAAKSAAAYVFAGTVEHSGNNILVRMHLDDARQNVTVWSSDFTGDAANPRPLQDEVSTQVAQVGAMAVGSDRLANGDTETMSLLIKSNQYSLSNVPGDREAEWENGKQLVAKLPGVAQFHSDFAIVGAFLAADSTPERAAELRTISKEEAQRALAIDPRDSLAYLAQYFLFPSAGHWNERERPLLQGLSAKPQDAALTNNESNLLREVGRLKDALDYARQAQAVLPASANRNATLIMALGATGNSFEAGPLADSSGKAWPAHAAIWNARLETAIYALQWDAALALLAPGGYVPLPQPVADAWRAALKAAQSGNPAAKRDASRLMKAQIDAAPAAPMTPPYETETPGSEIAMLAILGDSDAAFTESAAYLKRGSYADSGFLFWPNLTGLRRDPRFMPLADEVGLVDYWQKSGKWPDFCGDTGLPYDCRKQADKLSGSR